MKDLSTVFINRLEGCATLQDIDILFASEHIDGLEDRAQILMDYMGVIGTDSLGNITPEEEYGVSKEVFLRGDWRFINGKLGLRREENLLHA